MYRDKWRVDESVLHSDNARVDSPEGNREAFKNIGQAALLLDRAAKLLKKSSLTKKLASNLEAVREETINISRNLAPLLTQKG